MGMGEILATLMRPLISRVESAYQKKRQFLELKQLLLGRTVVSERWPLVRRLLEFLDTNERYRKANREFHAKYSNHPMARLGIPAAGPDRVETADIEKLRVPRCWWLPWG